MNYHRQESNDDDQPDYSQNLGLKKMLYKYEHENQQLRTQIKALTQRLQDITSRKQQQKNNKSPTKKDDYQALHQQILRKQMNHLFAQIEETKNQIHYHKERVNQQQEQKITKIENSLKNTNQEIVRLKYKISKYQTLKDNHHQKEHLRTRKVSAEQPLQDYDNTAIQLQKTLQQIKKNIRQLQKARDFNRQADLKIHRQFVDLGVKNRSLQRAPSPRRVEEEQPRKKKGLWYMQYTQQNYRMIKDSIQQLRKQKQQILQPIRQENSTLRNKLDDLHAELQQLNKDSQVSPEINMSSRVRRKLITPRDKNEKRIFSAYNNQEPPKEFVSYQPTNDKNFIPKKPRKVEWNNALGPASGGISWDDSNLKSPIVGINMWMDGHLLGIQFLHTLGESSQHLQLPFKKINPIQYRLNNDDYLQNLILHLNDNRIVGLQLFSKNGKIDSFGLVKGKGKVYNFGIKKPEKPLVSYGTFKVGAQNVSWVSKLGFEVI